MHGGPAELPADEDELLHARRLVAQRCLYGVDRNPMAIDLARLSLWLVTLARDHEFTFIDHALRHGDSLVGLTRSQIQAFHWKPDAPRLQFGTETTAVQRQVARVAELRQMIRDQGDDAPESELRERLDEADGELRNVRSVADLLLSAFFEGGNKNDRETHRARYADRLLQEGLGKIAARGAPALLVAPFHWELEFPEVFERENPGFDAVVGNPPFAGKRSIATANPAGYPDWLQEMHAESRGKVDLAAHFYRRAFGLLRTGGFFGLIATNTIAQGDTRNGGLRWICEHGGAIYHATRRVAWPGEAAVIVSVVHVARGEYAGQRVLDGETVERITAFLHHRGGHTGPARLPDNAGKSFRGSVVRGMGFTFDDTDAKGVASSLADMRPLIDADPHNGEVIFAYIGGEEVNTSPTHAHHRYVIDFGSRNEAECRRRWSALMEIVEERVRPERMKLSAGTLRERWWQFEHRSAALQRAIASLDRVLAISQVTSHAAFAFLPTGMVYGHTLNLFPFGTYAAFCALQSRVHEVWARFFGSSLEDRLRYTTADCFETFPFPKGWDTDPALEAAGRAYHEHRAALMVDTGEGMTKTYNRFHDPGERAPVSPASGNCTLRWTAPFSTPTAGPTSPPTASSYSSTKPTRRRRGPKRSLTATAGPTKYMTSCSPA